MAVYPASLGYVQRIDMAALQACAERLHARIAVAALPGGFVGPGRPLARVVVAGTFADEERECVAAAFRVGTGRLFDEDPRLGLVVLAEIAGRALSPAVNDPGTAIDILGRATRLLADWSRADDGAASPVCDRVEVPALLIEDLFDDAFTPVARDGAGIVEVQTRLQKMLALLACAGDGATRRAAMRHSALALARAERAMALPEDLAVVRELAARVGQAPATDAGPA